MGLPHWAAAASGAVSGAAAAGFAGEARRGAAWMMLASVARFLGSVIAALALARLLDPAEFGLVGMITPLVVLLMIFADTGFSAHTLQRERVDEEGMNLAFWTGVAVALGLSALFALAAPAMAWFYDEPRLTPLALAMASIFALASLRIQHGALCRRCMRQDIVAKAEIVDTAASVGVGVTLGALGFGAWALVSMSLTRMVVHAAVLWTLSGWRPGRPRGLGGLREMVGFGGAAVLGELVNFLGRSVDKILIGWRFGAVALGYYQIAYQLMLLPFHQVQSPIGGVAIPYLSRLRDDAALFREAVATVAAGLAYAIWPAMILAAMVAEPLLVTAIGETWRPAAPIFALLAVSALGYSVRPVATWSLLALGRADRALAWNAASAAVMVAGVAAGLGFGPVGAAAGFAAAELVAAPAVFLLALRGRPHDISGALARLLGPAAVTAAAAAALWAALRLGAGDSALAALAAAALVWIAAALSGALLVFGARRSAALVAAALGRLRRRG